MLIRSNWKLTFVPPTGTPLVILDFDEALEGEFSFPWRQEKQGSNRVRATHAANYARGNASNGMRFATVKDHASDLAARQWCLDLQLALDDYSGVTGTLKLEVAGTTTYYEMASASIDEAEPAVRVTGVARTTTAWELGGCGWTSTTPP